MNIELKHIGKSAEDLRFFSLLSGRHAGGITVHSVEASQFSYGIAVSPPMRRRGAAAAALHLLFARMKAMGFSRAVVQIAPDNDASLRLHRSLGFALCGEDTGGALILSKTL